MTHVDHPLQSPATLSSCTGIRGIERGVERAIGPLRTIAYVEIEAFAIENLLAGMEAGILDPAPIWTNLKTFPWGHFRGKVDLMLGGYPCQPFSNAGLRLGTVDPRHLWPYIERGIDTIRPVRCFFENVAAHLNSGYREVKQSLEKMGYIVKEGIYAAQEVGAPHLRERLFILAILADAKGSGIWGRTRDFFEKDGGSYGKCLQQSYGSGEELGKAGRPAWWPHYTGRGRRDENSLFGEGQEGANRPQCTGEELANAYGDGTRTDVRGITGESGKDESEAQREERDNLQRQRGGPDIRDGGSDVSAGVGLADSCGEGLAPRGEQPAWEEQQTAERGSCFDRWPARPGQSQQAWESPRIISRAAESSMGCAIDGYSFREDLLRALGNSVVEQQAEYAFRDLMRKHGF